MTLLILGLVLWFAAHLFKRLAPKKRAALDDKMGNGSKGLFAVAIVLSVVLMVIGYRGAEFIYVWSPPSFLTHLNNLLMLIALYIYGAGGPKGAKVWIGTKIRHPQLIGFKTWAFAHLLVNGDLAAIILFGGLLAWAVLEVILINRAEGPWTPPPQKPFKREIVLIVVALALYGIIAWVHTWLGYYPFGG